MAEANPLHFEWTQDGEAGLMRTLDEVNRRLKALEATHRRTGGAEDQHRRSTDAFANAMRVSSTAAQGAGMRLNALQATIGMASQTVGRFSQGAGQMVGILGQSTGAISSMTAGMGPWGAAISAAITGASLLATALSNAKEETRSMGVAMRQELQTLEQFSSAIDRAEAATRARAGAGSQSEQQEHQRGIEHQISRARAQERDLLAGLAVVGDNDEARRSLEGALATLRAGLPALQARQEQAEVMTPMAAAREAERPERGRGGRGGSTRDFVISEATLTGMDAFFGSRSAAMAADPRSMDSLMGGSEGGFQSAVGASRSRTGGRDRISKDDSAAREHEAWAMAEGYSLAADEAERLRDITLEVGDAFSEVLQKVLDGEENLGAAFLQVASERVKAVGYEMVAKGTAHVLEGTALLATLVTAGPGLALMATGAQEVGIGAAFIAGGYLAAAGAKATSTAGGGGAGGGARARARPEGRAALGGGEGGSVTNIININSPVDEASLGRMQARAERAAARQGRGFIRA